MNRNEIFETVKNHLLLQKDKSANEEGCLYRDGDGRKCAIGCLIPDSLYEPFIEGVSVMTLDLLEDTFKKPERLSNISKKRERLSQILEKINIKQEDFPLLSDLQQCHDERRPEDWPKVLESIAAKYSL